MDFLTESQKRHLILPKMENITFEELEDFANDPLDVGDTMNYIARRSSMKEPHLYLSNDPLFCVQPVVFLIYSIDEITQSQFNYDVEGLNFIFSSEIIPMFPFDKHYRPYSYHKLEQIKQTGQYYDTIDCIHRALNKEYNYVFFDISLIAEPIPDWFNDELVLHSHGVLFDFHDHDDIKGYLIESAISNTNWKQFEYTLYKSIKNEMKLKYGLDVTIIGYDIDQCPPINIQGDYSTCGVWAYYLFLLTIYNDGNRTIVFNELSKMTQKERNLLLLMFIYSMYKLGHKKPMKYDNFEPIVDFIASIF